MVVSNLKTVPFTDELVRRQALSEYLRFVKIMYKAKYGKAFVVRDHHIKIAEALWNVLTGKCKRLIINIAPRYGKTELAVKMFIAFGLAINAAAKFIHLSYSDNLALDNSDAVNDYIKHEAYTRLFPHVKLGRKDSKGMWSTTEDGGVYATSTAGQVTGFGAGGRDQSQEDEDAILETFIRTLDKGGKHAANPATFPGIPDDLLHAFKTFYGAIIIDDPIKPEDAESEQIRTKINTRFDNTIRSRVNSKETPIIIIMQRTHPDDLTGHVMKTEPGQWVQVSIPACDEETQQVLDPTLHTYADFMKMKKRDPITYYRQYQQKDKTREGLLYRRFDTYKNIPPGASPVRALCDPKDKGTDYLADVFYRVIYIKGKPTYAYVVDLVYTQNPPEETEIEVARKVKHWRVQKHITEANNGGRYFSRNVKDMCARYKHHATEFIEYTQRKNKETRITTQAANVNNFFRFPEGWEDEHYEAYKSLEYFLAAGKNLHDDLQDALTAIYEREVIFSEDGVTQS